MIGLTLYILRARNHFCFEIYLSKNTENRAIEACNVQNVLKCTITYLDIQVLIACTFIVDSDTDIG